MSAINKCHTRQPVDKVLGYAIELTDRMGYHGSGSAVTTYSLLTIMLSDEPLERRVVSINTVLAHRHSDVRFETGDFMKPDTQSRVAAIKEHFIGLDDSGKFAVNVKNLFEDGYAEPHDFGLLCYLPEGYRRGHDIKREVAQRQSIPHSREYFGEEGKRYTDLPLGSAQLLTTYNTMYSPMYIYRLTLKDGYNLIWKTSVRVAEATLDAAQRVSFIVKAHNEYRGCPQTEITRAHFAA